MSVRSIPWSCLILCLGALFAQAEETIVDKIIEAGRDNSQVMRYGDVITNQIGPRLTSSDGLQRACEWARDEFAKLGLENARLEKWGEFPVGFDRGPWKGRMIEPVEMNLEFGTHAWTAGTKGGMQGPAILIPDDLESVDDWEHKDKLTGGWVFFRGQASGGRRGVNSEAQERARRIMQQIEAAGVAGIVRSTRDDLILTGGNYRISWDELPKLPVINLQKAQFDAIIERLTKEERVILEFDIRNFFRKGPIPLYNVIADIPGTEFPDEYVVVGGHLDSWDGATGATDNASGCATTLETARILMAAGVKPRRTIRFMLWTGEEQGLLGSRAYVEAHPEVAETVSAVLVHDGGTNYVSGIRGTKDMKEDFDRIFGPVTQLDPRTPFEVEVVDAMRGGGSDHSSYLRVGVPGFFWNQAGRATYRQTHHTQFDTYDAIVPEYQQHTSIVIAVGATGIANLDALLPRQPVR